MTLDLEQLRTGIMGLTPEFGSFCLQACTVCLEHSNHTSGVTMAMDGVTSEQATLNWASSVDSRVQRNWSDTDEAAEYAATGVAILLSQELTTFTCIERSKKGTGFDYWIGDENSTGLFQRKARLEISGIFKASIANTLQSRLRQKEKQTSKSSYLGMNAVICVTEFSNPQCAYNIIA